MSNIKVILLTAGDSSRLWPLTDKNFINFFNRPLVYYTLAQLKRFSLTQVVAVVNSSNIKQFNDIKFQFPDLNISLVEQGSLGGMAGAMLSAEKYIKGDKILVISPTDVVEDKLFSDFKRYLAVKPDGLLAGTTSTYYFPGGYLTVSGGYITDLVEKPLPERVPGNLVRFVFNYFKNADFLISAIKKIKSNKDDIYEKAIKLLIKNNFRLKFLPYKGFWGHIKYPWHILSMNEYFLGKIKLKVSPNTDIHSSVIIEGEVIIEDKVRIMENVKIIGPTYIGSKTIIGNNSLIRQSHLGSNCVIGFSCEIARSHIGNNCWFHSNYLGDSIIADNVSMGAGAVIANFRLDEQNIKSVVNEKKIDTNKLKLGAVIGENTRIGINASLMPGVKIGSNSIVGSGVVLSQDLTDNKFCSVTDKSYVIRKNAIKVNSTYRSRALNNLK